VIERLHSGGCIGSAAALTRLYQATKGYRMDIDAVILDEATRRVDAEIYAARDE
jgi:hypothetical protein